MGQAPTIAIVDDDEGVRTALANLVRSLGYLARTYRSGQEFLGDRLEREPACMIVDVQMPGITGEQLQENLVSTGRRFPMIFMTAFPSETLKQRIMAAGAHCFLSKPADGDTIIRCIEEALSGHPALH